MADSGEPNKASVTDQANTTVPIERQSSNGRSTEDSDKSRISSDNLNSERNSSESETSKSEHSFSTYSSSNSELQSGEEAEGRLRGDSQNGVGVKEHSGLEDLDSNLEQNKKKDEEGVSNSVGSQSPISPATTPASLSGLDSGVGLTSPDDPSLDVVNNVMEEADDKLQCEDSSNLRAKSMVKDITTETFHVNASDIKAPNTEEEISTTQADGAGIQASSERSHDQSDLAAGGQESVYYIKWIWFNKNQVPIITQNENGPCPLLAIMNVLLLNGKVKLAPMMEMVTSEQLMTYLGDCILDSRPQNLSEMTQANYEQNMQDAMGILYKLQTGLDVNVKFAGVGDFEYTPECIIFDLLEIGLYHGWLVDPQDIDTLHAVEGCSYNQLVESIIALKASSDEEEQRKGLIAEQFLDRSASQLTYHGLCELSSIVKDRELCVFFRNNHFNTLYKHKNELFLLVTDQGYMTEGGVVWETLSNVEGDGHFVDANFHTFTKPVPSTEPIPDPSVPAGSAEQIDHDYQVALSLQGLEEDVSRSSQQEPDWSTDQEARTLADHELAMHLQEQENQQALSQQQHQQPHQRPQRPPHQHSQGRPPPSARGYSNHEARRRQEEDKDSKCVVL